MLASGNDTNQVEAAAVAGPNSAEGQHMVIVAGHIVVDPQQRESYLADCVSVVMTVV